MYIVFPSWQVGKTIYVMTTKLKNILRCYAMGMGIKSISATLEISRNTVRKYVRKFLDSGISIDSLLSMEEHRLQEIFVGGQERSRESSVRVQQLEALLPDYANRLKKKGVTIKSLYEEYRRNYPDGLRHSCFGSYLQRYRLSQRVIGHVEHYAGEQMYVDFAGDRLKLYDGITGEPRAVEVFVAILPCSHYTYCEAVNSQRKEDLMKGCENAMHFFGGAPQAIVPDNLKSAVTKNDSKEAIINEDFAAFAEYYGCVVYPARVRHPKDKALVENAVRLMYRNVYAALEGRLFHTLEEINLAIREALEKFNDMKMSGRNESRRQLFENSEQDYLKPLPERPYILKQRKSMTVMQNSYVTLFKHHYSMPKEYVGKRVELVYDADTVEIYYGLRLVTVHTRDDSPYEYSTKSAHKLPGRHGSYADDMENLYSKAASIDNIVLLYLKEVAANKKYPPLAYRSCKSILSLQEKYGEQRLVAACACASEKLAYGYQEIYLILQNGEESAYMNTEEDTTEPVAGPIRHNNIRGREYYSKSNNINQEK